MNLAPMQLADLDDVMEIESSVYSHPWTKRNFIDSVESGYDAWVMRSAAGELLGYFVQAMVVDEMHILTIAVKESVQGQGMGLFLLTSSVARAKQLKMVAVSLEVRTSNVRALAVYKKFGFVLIGQRKNYYPIQDGGREDALILHYAIES